MEPDDAVTSTVAALRAEIGRRGWSQVDLARRLGVSQSWVSRRMTGGVAFTVGELEQAAIALDVPLAALLPDAGRVAS